MLQGDLGLDSRDALEQLCCTLWAKSNNESKLIQRLFQQMWVQLEDKAKTSLSDDSEQSSRFDYSEEIEQKSDRNNEISTNDFLDSKANNELAESPAVTLEDEPVQVVKAVRNQAQDSSLIRPRYSLLNDYFPVTTGMSNP